MLKEEKELRKFIRTFGDFNSRGVYHANKYITAFRRAVVEECAKKADGMGTQTVAYNQACRHIAAAIRKMK